MSEEELRKQIAESTARTFKLNQQLSLVVNGNKKRNSFFPMQNMKTWEFVKKQYQNVWFAEEIPFADDRNSFDSLTFVQKNLLQRSFVFLNEGDTALVSNITMRFMAECLSPEETSWYVVQAFIENVHAETYGQFILAYTTEDERNQLTSQAGTAPGVSDKINWIEKYSSSDQPRRIRFLQMALSEIFFTPIFVVVFFFRTLGKMEKLIHANKLIMQDEMLHFDYGMFQCKENGGVTKEEATQMITEAVAIEKKHMAFLLGKDNGHTDLRDLTLERLELYCEFVGDLVMIDLGFKPIYKSENPFEWMNQILMESRSNFLEVKQSYKRGNLIESMRIARGEAFDQVEEYSDDVDF